MKNKNDKKLVLYGTGVEGEKFYWRWRDEYEIAFCIDRSPRQHFHGLDVYQVENVKDVLSEYMVIICASGKNRIEIETLLLQYALIKYENFTYTELFEKKLAILYGNCHMVVLKDYLNNNPYFLREYSIRYFFAATEDPVNIDIKNCDLLITQRIGGGSGGKSSTELISQVKESCKTIIIPNLYGINLFFPQTIIKDSIKWEKIQEVMNIHMGENALQCNCDIYEYFETPRKFPEALSRIGLIQSVNSKDENLNIGDDKSIDKLVNMMWNEDVYSKESIINTFESGIEKLRERERFCDIQISDYILQNYKEVQTFYEPNHPTPFVIYEKGRRILKLLNIEIHETDLPNRRLDNEEVFIYGCVKRVLGLKFEQKFIRYNSQYRLQNQPLDMKEFVRDSLKWNGKYSTERV